MCIKLICIILPEISAHHSVAIEIIGGHFFSCHPYIESTTVLSDKMYNNYIIVCILCIMNCNTPIEVLLY